MQCSAAGVFLLADNLAGQSPDLWSVALQKRRRLQVRDQPGIPRRKLNPPQGFDRLAADFQYAVTELLAPAGKCETRRIETAKT